VIAMANVADAAKKMDGPTIEQARQYFINDIQHMEPDCIQRLWEFYISGGWNTAVWRKEKK